MAGESLTTRVRPKWDAGRDGPPMGTTDWLQRQQCLSAGVARAGWVSILEAHSIC